MAKPNYFNLISVWNPKMALSVALLVATGIDAFEFGLNNNQNQFGLGLNNNNQNQFGLNNRGPFDFGVQRAREYTFFGQNNNRHAGFGTVDGHFGNKVDDRDKPLHETIDSKCVELSGRMYCK